MEAETTLVYDWLQGVAVSQEVQDKEGTVWVKLGYDNGGDAFFGVLHREDAGHFQVGWVAQFLDGIPAPAM